MRGKTLVITGLALLWATAASAQRMPISGSWVAMLGPKDTVAVEHYSRSGDRIEGVSVEAYPRAMVRSYEITFTPSGKVEHVHIATGRPGRTPGATVDYTYTADSVTVEMRRDTVMRHATLAYEGVRPLPFYEDLFEFWELSLGREMASARDSATFGTLAGSHVMPIAFRRGGAEAASFGSNGWGTGHATFSGGRTLERLDLTGTTSKYTVQRVGRLNVYARATAWAARPQPGLLSPRDTASARVGEARVAIDYGRPAVRGREIFGRVVPWDQVWRLGANAATQLITDRELVIGSATIPAGTYSLWAVPKPTGWTLIVNRQHGQWGTEYHAKQDFAHIPMKVSPLTHSIERFTIRVTPNSSQSGTITMEWAKTSASVGFKVR